MSLCSNRNPCGKKRPRGAPGGGRRGAPHAGAVLAHDLRAVRRHGGAQGREPAAHGLVQAARRAGQARRARRRLRRRRGRRLGRQPRAGAGLRRARARRAVRGLHARPTRRSPRSRRRAALGAERARSAASSVDECVVAAARARRRGGPGVRPPVRRPGRRSPARARSGSSCSRTCRDLAAVVVPVGGGGLASGIAIAVKSARPGGAGRRRPGRGVRAVPAVAARRASRCTSTRR